MRDWLGAVLVGVGIVVILVGVHSNAWWVGEGRIEVGTGLRSVTICRLGQCASVEYSKILIRGAGALHRNLGAITYFLSLGVALFLALGVVHRELTGVPDLARWAGRVTGSLIALGLFTLFTFPGRTTVLASFSLGPGFFILAGGVVLAIWGALRSPPERRLPLLRVAVPGRPGPSMSGPVPPPGPAPVAGPVPAPVAGPVPAPVAAPRRPIPVEPIEVDFGDDAGPGPGAGPDGPSGPLRFVVREVDLNPVGFTVRFADDDTRDVMFTDIGLVRARALPVGAPADEAVFIDLVPQAGVVGAAVLRIVPATPANYADIAEDVISPLDGMRRLGARIEQEAPGAIEPASRPFFLQEADPPALASAAELVAYDADYDRG